jgi:hypothetical protein
VTAKTGSNVRFFMVILLGGGRLEDGRGYR